MNLQQGDGITMNRKKMEIFSIGEIKRTKYATQIWIDEDFRPALKDLAEFSHIIVFWWADRFEHQRFRSRTQTKPFYDKAHKTGIFATRSPVRPNPIMITTCLVEEVDLEKGLVLVQNIDVINGTPLIDIKPFYACYDQPRKTHIPARFPQEWNAPIPEDGVGLEEEEVDDVD